MVRMDGSGSTFDNVRLTGGDDPCRCCSFPLYCTVTYLSIAKGAREEAGKDERLIGG